MTGIRRIVCVIGLTLAVVAGIGLPASANFAASVPVATTAVVTPTVQPPTDVRVTITCDTSNMYATVRWTRSNSDDISGYRVIAAFGSDEVALQAGRTASRLDYTFSRMWAAYKVPVTVTTLTDYGWTKTSAAVQATTC
jgi:hypothetical protein